jgi:NADPH:quinone reductase
VRAQLQPEEWVLVQGAGGGAGSAAVQIAKALGAHVVAVVSTPDKRQVATAAGADVVIDADDDWPRRVKAATGGVHAVFDPVGGDRFPGGLRTLRSQGRYIVVGFASGVIPTVK